MALVENTQRLMQRIATPWRLLARWVAGRMPKSLYARSLIIIITPMVVLQVVVAFVFMERHWQSVTRNLSEAVIRDVAAIVAIIDTYPQDTKYETVTRLARDNMALNISILPDGPLPAATPKPFFSILDGILSKQITRQINRPFWIDTVGDSNLLEIRIKLKNNVLRVFVRRNRAYASNTRIFLLWMVGASLVLIIISILFLRNQIRPIQRLAEAAEAFGKGRSLPDDFRPRGAQEVRRAGLAFLEMRRRIERQLEQRAAMLAGVSHDLRTILTRFKLQLVLLTRNPGVDALEQDVNDMQGMLEGYLNFAQGEDGEQAKIVNLAEILKRFDSEAELKNRSIETTLIGEETVNVRPLAFTRLLSNLVSNAFYHAENVELSCDHTIGWLTITIDDDGPGIPKAMREEVFKPFFRLDEARNQDDSGTGLGLAIARDIAHSHGGKITLDESPMGGLRAVVKIPA